MEPFVGGLIAAIAAWVSILLVIALPAGKLRVDVAKVRLVGATTIALFALQLLGLKFPSWLPLLVFGLGLLLALATEPKDAGGQFNN